MIDRFELFRRRLWVWLPALLFLVANVALFSTYRLVYAGQVQSLRGRLAEREAALAKLTERGEELDRLTRSARDNRERLDTLYTDRLAAERQRFTRLVAEIKELAARSGLEPTSISYPGEDLADFGLVKRYFTFSVEGTYAELREFVKLLELTPSFVTLEQVNLNETQNTNPYGGASTALLNMDLKLSSLFVRDHGPGSGDLKGEPATLETSAPQGTPGGEDRAP